MRKDNILRRINTIISDLKSIERKVENNEMETYDLEKLYRELDDFLYIINQFWQEDEQWEKLNSELGIKKTKKWWKF